MSLIDRINALDAGDWDGFRAILLEMAGGQPVSEVEN